MYRKIVMVIGAIAVIVSLMNPIIDDKNQSNVRSSIFVSASKPAELPQTNYYMTTARTIAIAVGATALFFVVPNRKKDS